MPSRFFGGMIGGQGGEEYVFNITLTQKSNGDYYCDPNADTILLADLLCEIEEYDASQGEWLYYPLQHGIKVYIDGVLVELFSCYDLSDGAGMDWINWWSPMNEKYKGGTYAQPYFYIRGSDKGYIYIENDD